MLRIYLPKHHRLGVTVCIIMHFFLAYLEPGWNIFAFIASVLFHPSVSFLNLPSALCITCDTSGLKIVQRKSAKEPSKYLCRVSCLLWHCCPSTCCVCMCVYVWRADRWHAILSSSALSGCWHVPSTVIVSLSRTHQRSSWRRAWWSKWHPVDEKDKSREKRPAFRYTPMAN